MARLTPSHQVQIQDPRAGISKRHDDVQIAIATATQVGGGVRLVVPINFVMRTREDWEKLKLAVEAAWRDNDEIPCKDPIW